MMKDRLCYGRRVKVDKVDEKMTSWGESVWSVHRQRRALLCRW